MPQFIVGEKVDVLFDDAKGFTKRQPGLVVSAPTGSRGIGAMVKVRITRPSAGPYSGITRAHRDLVTARRAVKNFK